MSSGPSRMNEKPRSAWSNCIDETPMSNTTPSRRVSPLSAKASARTEKGVRTSRNLPG